MKKLLLFILISISCTENQQTGLLGPVELTCEYIKNPSVVDIAQPRLAWVNTAREGERGQKQTAYQIRVASSPELLESPDLWDSEKVASDQSARVEYAGKQLSSRMECWWQVRVWDGSGNPTDWSDAGFWRMGLLEKSDWTAQWIGAPWDGEEHFKRPDFPGQKFDEFGPPAPMLRKQFEIRKEIDKAVTFVTGLGYFEFYVNGEKVGDDVLVPNNTNYGKRPLLGEMYINVEDNFKEYKVMYLAYDITKKLKNGDNVVGALLGNGFYNPRMFWCEGYGTPRFLGQLHITYKDGTEEIISSDASWTADKSPILKNMVYYGETYDARLEQPGWSTAGFDDSSWKQVAIKEAPEGKLVAHTAPTDKVMEQLSPVNIEKLENGNYFVDFGKEISGWVRLNNVQAPSGHQIDISFNGNLYSGDNTYIFKGDEPESYAPRFNWFVFSGIEITNWPGELKPEHLTAEAVNTFVEETAVFETSNPLFNQINEIWQRSQLDNMHGSIASDCPHRERNGYTGDGQVSCVTVMHNFDARAFYQKWIRDMLGAQNPETGYVPNGAPWQPGCGGGVAWGAAICIMPWEFYIHYGSLDMLKDNYDGMKGYIKYMQSWVGDDGIMRSQRRNNSGEILKWFNLGEWVAPGETVSDEFVHTFYFWYCADITAKVANILGDKSGSETFGQLAETTRNAFHRKFYDAEAGSYGDGGGDILALKMGVPQEQYPRVISALKNNIKSNKGHLDTGIFGTRFFFETLAENGLNDLAYEAMNKTDEPGFGHWIELGSTTSREQWGEGGSHNHPMFGGGLVWLYRNLAGMQADPDQPGYKHIIFKPQPVDDLQYVEYSNETPYGRAGIMWANKNGEFSMDVNIPVGSYGTVYIPTDKADQITESGEKINKNPYVRLIGKSDGYTILEVESGNYSFSHRKN
jgi:alpha-L-rhamnosidase